jgi:alpha-beta hydrolase superfamily lysophospholipase
MDRCAGHSFFVEHGYAVWTFDAHGHGASEPLEEHERFAIYRFADLVTDAEQFIIDVVQPWVKALKATVPLYLLGASAGALTVRNC